MFTIRGIIKSESESEKKIDELQSIVFPNKSCDFTRLKNEIARLKIKELAPQLQNQKEQIEKLISDSKEQLSEESKKVLDFYLTTLKQEVSYGEKSLKAGKLAAYEGILETKLTSENVMEIRQLQEKINQDQKHLDNRKRRKGKPRFIKRRCLYMDVSFCLKKFF